MVRDAGIAPSMGAVGTPADNAMIESFWGRMQVELFNRLRWKTRIELATAIHDYIELWHNTKRRHSAPRGAGCRSDACTSQLVSVTQKRPSWQWAAAPTHRDLAETSPDA